jgi:hypothetical protein
MAAIVDGVILADDGTVLCPELRPYEEKNDVNLCDTDTKEWEYLVDGPSIRFYRHNGGWEVATKNRLGLNSGWTLQMPKFEDIFKSIIPDTKDLFELFDRIHEKFGITAFWAVMVHPEAMNYMPVEKANCLHFFTAYGKDGWAEDLSFFELKPSNDTFVLSYSTKNPLTVEPTPHELGIAGIRFKTSEGWVHKMTEEFCHRRELRGNQFNLIYRVYELWIERGAEAVAEFAELFPSYQPFISKASHALNECVAVLLRDYVFCNLDRNRTVEAKKEYRSGLSQRVRISLSSLYKFRKAELNDEPVKYMTAEIVCRYLKTLHPSVLYSLVIEITPQ